MEHLGKRLAKAVSGFTETMGFRYVAARNTFVRKTEYGFDAFLWTSYPTISNNILGQRYSLIIELRHNSVQNVVNQLGLIHGEVNQKNSSTVCSVLELFPLSSSRRYSYFLANSASDEHIHQVAQAIAEAVKEDACPFFQRYSSLKECALGLNSLPNSAAHFLFNNHERRMYYAIATAFLVGLPERESLIEQWGNICKELFPEGIRSRAQKKLLMLINILGVAFAKP